MRLPTLSRGVGGSDPPSQFEFRAGLVARTLLAPIRVLESDRAGRDSQPRRVEPADCPATFSDDDTTNGLVSHAVGHDGFLTVNSSGASGLGCSSQSAGSLTTSGAEQSSSWRSPAGCNPTGCQSSTLWQAFRIRTAHCLDLRNPVIGRNFCGSVGRKLQTAEFCPSMKMPIARWPLAVADLMSFFLASWVRSKVT